MGKTEAPTGSLQGSPWPADEVVKWPIDRITPFAQNPRLHSPEQIAQLVASMKEWGWTNPILVDEEGTLIAGHGRVLAARELGFTDVPVMIARGWTEAQKAAYVIADNKLAENATWDRHLLRLQAADLQRLGFNMPLVGFSELELKSLLGAVIDPKDEWGGMPEFEHSDMQPYRRLIVNFLTAEHFERFAALMDQPITDKTRSIWFPAIPDQDLSASAWESEDEALAGDA